MTMQLPGTPSDELPAVLATGATDVAYVYVSMAQREASGRDADYLEWHSLDHRAEQHRIAGLRQSLRLVSTPACRAARAHEDIAYAGVDHVMTYFFSADAAFEQFNVLSAALGGERRPFRLPSVDVGYYHLAGKRAARRAIAGADVLPWRPARGVYLLLERGCASPATLAEIDGIAGLWWFDGGPPPGAGARDNSGLSLTCCFIDGDPLASARSLREALRQRWATAPVEPLLAAPFHTLVPFEWARYLP